ncbi:ferredoxin [Microbacterium terrae]|uniref:Ferredoxin n=1 Tax=Microbacterium terrae TaxID=69369 RepID=A0A0M2HI77_9MICO|nr:ferredoxin [Microbacterium terrae]KJL44023.1 Ferredoxin-2 [Microbacterium terrae]MBP1079443.1 ferredoxin [Microbacterium terrae]GLJ98844.1 ferredoxin [Microbacterium terrae]
MRNKVEFDEPRCVSSGLCVMAAPDVFDQRDDDGVAIVLIEEPGDDLIDDVREAVTICPAAALRLVRE